MRTMTRISFNPACWSSGGTDLVVPTSGLSRSQILSDSSLLHVIATLKHAAHMVPQRALPPRVGPVQEQAEPAYRWDGVVAFATASGT